MAKRGGANRCLGISLVLVGFGTTPLLAQTADLAITETVSPQFPLSGSTLTYTLTVTNLGPGTATGVTVVDVPSPLLTPEACSASANGACSAVGTGATFPSVAPGSTEIVTITAVVSGGDPGETITNSCSVSADAATVDPVMTNNTAMANVTIGGPGSIGLSAASLDFGNERLNKLSAPRYVTLTNTGATELSIFGIVSNTAEFIETTDCPIGGVLSVGGHCTVGVRFDPSAVGTRTGSISVSDGDPTSPQVVTLSGSGVQSKIALSSTSLTFAPQVVGAVGSPKSVTLSNAGTSSLHISGIALTGSDFVWAASPNPCPAAGVLLPQSSCVLSVASSPAGSGTRLGTVTIVDDDASSPQIVGLSGSGEAVVISIDPLTFGDQTIGVPSAPLTETISVAGDTAVSFGAVTLAGSNPGDFAVVSNGCSGLSIPGGGSCLVSFTFTPTDQYGRHALVTIASGDPGSPAKFHLVGTGEKPAVTGIAVTPQGPGLGVGRTLSMKATASYNDGSTQDVTSSARWSSSASRVVTVGNEDSNKGIATGVAVGSAVATATYKGFSSQATVTTYLVPTLSFLVQPADTGVAAVISPAVTVLVVDPTGKPIVGQTVTIAIGPDPPHAAVLGGTLSRQTDASGRVVDGDLTLDYLGNGYTLVATAPTPGGPYAATSAPFDETRVGDPCLGPTPVCASSCPDSDGDGLNDAWETAGGIDFNGDGRIDSTYDLMLPGADPAKPDVFVQVDYMDYGLNQYGCDSDVECTNLGVAHLGDSCTGPPAGASARTCVHTCAMDGDCTALGPSHVGDRCIDSLCEHTHDPSVVGAGALDAVVASFAAHGINLHIDPEHHSVPHSRVVSWQQPTAVCGGADVAPGVIGAYAVNFYDLKAALFDPRRDLAYHYAVIGHYAECDSDAGCSACPATKGGAVVYETGQAEVSGNDFIVSLGHFFNDQGGAPGIDNLGGTFMHELGHNLGLHHGGGVTTAGSPCVPPQCEDLPTFKPNYLSVMNYSYQFTGILESDSAGSDVITGQRLDYSTQVLPTGGNTPGALSENGQLNEPAGLGSGTSDVFTYNDGQCGFDYAASDGPVDWDGDGVADNLNASSDLNQDDHLPSACSVRNQVLNGHVDWGPSPGQSIFTYSFQCTTFGADDRVGPLAEKRSFPVRELARDELTPEMAMRAHVLHPPKRVTVRAAAGCDGTVTLMGADGFDVRDVDPLSLRLAGAPALRTAVDDVDGDGRPDLVVVFDSSRMRAQRGAARLSGWLSNSQVIHGRVEKDGMPKRCE